jgi:uncharacterized membrane protein
VPAEVEAKVEKFRAGGPEKTEERNSRTDEPELVATAARRCTEKKGSVELDLGRVWLVRAGIVLLVTGLVFFGTYAYQNWVRELPAVVRLAALFACALALCGVGAWLARKDGLRKFGEVVMAGGLAFFYWCTFASHHVGRLQVIESPVLAAVLLLLAAGAIVGVSLVAATRG